MIKILVYKKNKIRTNKKRDELRNGALTDNREPIDYKSIALPMSYEGL